MRAIVTWMPSEMKFLRTLKNPVLIQKFLDSIEYSSESRYRCPRSVIHDKKAHCFDGAVFAAAMLKRVGYPPLIVDMQAVRDDDHVIAVYKKNGFWGAVAKSNFVGLRYREPIYRNIRELVMSYFDPFYNMNYEHSLRQFAGPLDLSKYPGFEYDEELLEAIGLKLSYIPVTKILTPAQIRGLAKVDERTYRAGMMGAVRKGIYFPGKKKT